MLTSGERFSKVRTLVAGRDPSMVEADLVALVRERSARAGRPGVRDAEIRAALAPLTPAQERLLRRELKGEPPARPLGPFAWADLARGLAPEVAAARELSSFYSLLAERDTLAALVSARSAAGGATAAAPEETRPPPSREAHGRRTPDARTLDAPERPALRRKSAPKDVGTRRTARADHLLGLFAYHRDAPRVARALGCSRAELDRELDELDIRRAAYRLTRGTDAELPIARPLPSSTAARPVRRRTRSEKDAPPARAQPPPLSEPELQKAALTSLLAEAGPRRAQLAARLGTAEAPLSDAALLARFRAAGLERELALRERDLVRALYGKHRAAERRVAAEMGLSHAALRALVVERGLARELDALRHRLRQEARESRWPRERIARVLHGRDELQDLGILEELEREVAARVRVLWSSLRKGPRPREALQSALKLTRDDAEQLLRLLDLR